MPHLYGFSKQFSLLAIAAFAIGAVAWSGHLYTLIVLLLLPLLFAHCTGTATRLVLLFCYYAGSIWPVMQGAAQFFGPTASMHPLSILTLWLVSSAVLTLPWFWIVFFKHKSSELLFPIGICITALLPTGVVNPLTIAGILFPGLAWVGLALTIAIFGTLIKHTRYTLIATAMIAAICYVSHPAAPAARGSWEAHQTQLGGAEITRETPQQIFKAADFIQSTALQSRATIQVFPEAVVSHWTPIADEFWQDTLTSLRNNHQTIIFGAEQSTRIPGQYLNLLLVRGQYTATYQQRVPIPYAMWKPWNHTGFPLYYFGPATLTIGQWKTAPVICYEQLIMAPILISMTQNPDVIVSVANDYWTNDTYIAEIQQAAVTSWSRLFRVPLIIATNR
jgi:hypothetical protein